MVEAEPRLTLETIVSKWDISEKKSFGADLKIAVKSGIKRILVVFDIEMPYADLEKKVLRDLFKVMTQHEIVEVSTFNYCGNEMAGVLELQF